MTIQHNIITDPDIHEPKGVASATSGKVYISNGSGSGTWEYPPAKPHAEIYISSGATTHGACVSTGMCCRSLLPSLRGSATTVHLSLST